MKIVKENHSLADKIAMITERQKVIRSFAAITISFTAVWYSTNYNPTSSRSTASFFQVGNCFSALKKIIKNYEVRVGGDVSIINMKGDNIQGKIHSYARGGLQINNSKGAYLISYSDVQSINGEALAEIEIYKKLLEGEVENLKNKDVNVHFYNGTNHTSIAGRDFEIGDETLNFTSIEDGRRMTFAYEKIYGLDVIDVAKETKKIRKDVKLLEGEFVTVELKSGENLDGTISLSLDGSRVEITDVDDADEVMAIPITDIKSIYQ